MIDQTQVQLEDLPDHRLEAALELLRMIGPNRWRVFGPYPTVRRVMAMDDLRMAGYIHVSLQDGVLVARRLTKPWGTRRSD